VKVRWEEIALLWFGSVGSVKIAIVDFKSYVVMVVEVFRYCCVVMLNIWWDRRED